MVNYIVVSRGLPWSQKLYGTLVYLEIKPLVQPYRVLCVLRTKAQLFSQVQLV